MFNGNFLNYYKTSLVCYLRVDIVSQCVPLVKLLPQLEGGYALRLWDTIRKNAKRISSSVHLFILSLCRYKYLCFFVYECVYLCVCVCVCVYWCVRVCVHVFR